MADPIQVLQLLGGSPVSAYTVFEADQVLTHGQLNELSLYLNQQQRLTRTQLVGVGLISGMELSVGNDAIGVSPGVGITTDGDLVVQPTALAWRHAKPYDTLQPHYPPFFSGEALMPLLELTDASADGAQPLPTLLDAPLTSQDRVVLALVETTEHDPDLCVGEGCDNLGRRATTRLRWLLATAADAQRLQASFEPVSERARLLPDLMATRPQLIQVLPMGGTGNTTPGTVPVVTSFVKANLNVGVASLVANPRLLRFQTVADTTSFLTAYRSACDAMVGDLAGAFALLAQHFQPELQALFPSGSPVDGWVQIIKGHASAMTVASAQLTYGFFKDLVDTWNDLVNALLDTTAILLPDANAFPKHLLLGSLREPMAWRTAFFPSVADTGAREAAARAGFLVRKLDTLIHQFAVPSDTTVRVTPSMGEGVSLEDRAVPWYYGADMARAWQFRASRRHQTDTLLGYRAAQYGGNARALNPLQGAIAGYEMFRVEGHLGRDVASVRGELQALIASKHLPFKVHAVLAHTRRELIRIKPPIRFTDLHRLHHLVRQDVALRLDEGETFTDTFAGSLKTAIAAKTIPDQLGGMVSASKTVEVAQASFKSFSAEARTTLAATRYTAYQSKVSATPWTTRLAPQLATLGDVRAQVGDAARNDLVTPLDSLVQTTHPAWLDWLDQLIVHREEQADDKLLLLNFLQAHPQLDHLGGTWRGGTLVLLYDDQGLVIGDFALPYPFEEAEEDEPELPVLKPPIQLRPIGTLHPVAIDKPIRLGLGELIDANVAGKVANLNKGIDERFAAADSAFASKFDKLNVDFVKQIDLSTSTLKTVLQGTLSSKGGLAEAAGLGGSRLVATGDALLDELAKDVDYKRQRVQNLVELGSRGDLSDDQRSLVKSQLTTAQSDLAVAVGATAEHVVAAKTDTTSAAAASVAGILAQGTILVTDKTASTALGSKLGALEVAAGTGSQKTLIGSLKNIGLARG